MTADLDGLGRWGRLGPGAATLTVAPDARSEAVRELDPRTALRVLGGSGGYYRVRLPDGALGYVPAGRTEVTDDPVNSQIVAELAPVLSGPDRNAPATGRLEGGTEVSVYGRFGDYLLVRSPDGQSGWLADGEAQQLP